MSQVFIKKLNINYGFFGIFEDFVFLSLGYSFLF